MTWIHWIHRHSSRGFISTQAIGTGARAGRRAGQPWTIRTSDADQLTCSKHGTQRKETHLEATLPSCPNVGETTAHERRSDRSEAAGEKAKGKEEGHRLRPEFHTVSQRTGNQAGVGSTHLATGK